MKENKLFFDNSFPRENHFVVEENSFLGINILSLKEEISSKIVIDVKKGGRFVGAFADFSPLNTSFKLEINLLEEGAKAEWHLGTMSSNKSKKEFLVDVLHKANNTEALVSNYGIARDQSRLIFKGTSSIDKGSIKSNTRQEAKIIVFDEGVIALASPALKIDENDVIASHAAVVGRLDDRHLFYLSSRGLSKEVAKRLIAMGYLNPIKDYFDDQKIKDTIAESIEGGFDNVRSL